jgi:hypothetical protein
MLCPREDCHAALNAVDLLGSRCRQEMQYRVQSVQIGRRCPQYLRLRERREVYHVSPEYCLPRLTDKADPDRHVAHSQTLRAQPSITVGMHESWPKVLTLCQQGEVQRH